MKHLYYVCPHCWKIVSRTKDNAVCKECSEQNLNIDIHYRPLNIQETLTQFIVMIKKAFLFSWILIIITLLIYLLTQGGD